jgi:hypothetical protein
MLWRCDWTWPSAHQFLRHARAEAPADFQDHVQVHALGKTPGRHPKGRSKPLSRARAAIVTGAGRGLGPVMALGLAHACIRMVATAAASALKSTR